MVRRLHKLQCAASLTSARRRVSICVSQRRGGRRRCICDNRYSDLRGFVLGVLVAALTARGDLGEALIAAWQGVPLVRDEGTLFWLLEHLALRAALAGRSADAALVYGHADMLYKEFDRPRE